MFMPVAVFFLAALLAFVALGVDIGYLALVQQRMQNANDAAALAAAMEISYAVETADDDVADVTQYAEQQARLRAAAIAEVNGFYVDPDRDVQFGRRSYDASTGQFGIDWEGTPPNVVRVRIHRDNVEADAPDSQVQLFFAGVFGRGRQSLTTSAAAYVESRDIVSVLDFSRSMNFDSYFCSEATIQLSQSEIEANLQKVWNDLGSPTYGNMPFTPTWVTIPSATWGESTLKVTWQATQVYIECSSNLNRVKLTFSNGNTQTFTTTTQVGTWAGTGSNAGKRITKCECRRSTTTETFDFYSNSHIKRGLGLTSVPYPFPVGSWDYYIQMVRDTSGSYEDEQIYNYGYRYKFGLMTFMHYLLRFECGHGETPDLWKTRHYPFHCLKEGQVLLCDFLEELSFNDYVGLVSYDTHHRVEDSLSGSGMPSVDISDEPITNDYQAIRDIIEHKQAGHYYYATNIGGGLKDAKQLLIDHGRIGARPTILLMTDGNSNTIDSGESTTLPSDWDWDELFDYDGDGEGDYYTSDGQKRYVLKIAKQCLDQGFTIHTIAMGADADRDLMRAIAFLGNGTFVDVPGGQSVSDMEADVMAAFHEIAAFVPPAQLLNDADE